jgi:signal transduction histidine kinase
MRSALSASAAYTRVENLATATRQAAVVVDALQGERDLVAGYMAAPRAPLPADLAARAHQADQAGAKLRTAFDGVDVSGRPSLHGAINAALSALDRLPALRQSISAAHRDPQAVFDGYTGVIRGLLGVDPQLSADSRNGYLSGVAFAVGALAEAKEAAAERRAILYTALQSHLSPLVAQVIGAQAQLTSYLDTFTAHADSADASRLRAMLSDADATHVDRIVTAAAAGRAPKAWGVTGAQWFSLASGQIGELRQVESAQFDDLLSTAHSLRSDARRAALASALAIYAILGFALLATLIVARSMLRPLQTLRSAALDVAVHRLPQTVRRLQQGGYGDVGQEVQRVRVESNDEIGQVARAFDAVHREAVRLAGEQALMRGNISAMFVNLSRRSQILVERQLRLIDDLEDSEQDPDRLANLFKLDHLATRMRRNNESLLVLAGADGSRRGNQPVPLLDVIRAASAEVEQYSRVKMNVQRGYELTSSAVNDTVHLLAELLENATAFSPPSTPVGVNAHGLGANGDVMIEIEDQGIGMSAEELEVSNDRLASPALVDVSMSRMMGLFVVARLAQRHRIQVRLRKSAAGGITALVRLPADVIINAGMALTPGAGLRTFVDPGARTADAANGAPGPGRITLSASLDPSDAPESSPIFDALQSEWFRRPGTNGTGDHQPSRNGAAASTEQAADAARADEPVAGTAGVAAAGATAAPASGTTSRADDGWRAAAAVRVQQVDATTPSGLPVRTPGRHLVPGSAGPSDRLPAATARPPQHGTMLSSYQQGVGRGRAAVSAADRPHPVPAEDER